MIDQLIAFSIKNKVVILFATIILIATGIYSLTQISIDAVPDITNNQVQIITNAPTFSAQEVERLITARLEISLSTLQKVVEIRSISRFGLSVITVVFEEDMPVTLARQLVSEKIKLVEQEIPTEIGKPTLAPITTGLGEVYQYVLKVKKGYENKYDITELRTIQDWIVKRRLAGIAGVVDISSFGGKVKQFEVAISPEKLRAYNLSLQEVIRALQLQNENTGGSYIEKNSQAYFIRGEGWLKGIKDIENVVIHQTTTGVPVLVKDVAQVRIGHAIRYGAMSQAGRGEVVGGIALMLKGENSVKVTHRIQERMREIQKSLPEGIEIETFLDRSQFVNRTIDTVINNLVEGGLIVVLVLVLFLGNLRAGLIVASVIPLAMLFAFSLMNIFGVSANLMSLGAIDFGLVVDGAVIIVEAILHRLHTHLGHKTTLTQTQLDEEVYQASVQIRKSAAFGEIIILIVYLPILSLVGIEGKMFRPMAQTISFAILGAFLLSLTYVPMLSAWALSKKIDLKPTFADKMMQKLERIYTPLLVRALRKQLLVLGTAVLLFAIALFGFTQLGGEFIPQLDEGDFAVEVRLKAGTGLSQTLETSQKLEKILMQFPEVKTVISKIGTAEIPTDPMPMEANDMMVILKDKSQWKTASTKEELADTLRKALSQVIGVGLDFQQPIAMRFNELMTGVKSDIALKIYGEDLEILAQKAKECAKYLRKIRGVVDLKVEQLEGVPQMVVRYEREKIAQYGLNIKDLNLTLKAAFAGEIVGQIYEGEKYFDLVVRFEQNYRRDINDLKNLYITLPNGLQVPLSQVATVQYQNAPMQISRDNAKRRITVGFNAQGRDVESIVQEAKQILEKKVKLPAGYYFEYGGQFKNLEQAKQRLSIAVPIALALIFSLLYFTFHSWLQSILIFTAIPLSAIGGVAALYLRGMPFSISAGIGFIALFGVAVLNGIVLLSYFNQLEQKGIKNIYKRLLLGTRTRLRPVLMTATVASLGFMPMALSHGAGAEVQKPLATVVIGGLISATLLTLIVLPILYLLTHKPKHS
ncbi:MAG: CusA/CzcA family heavy metal efflux RND transporter [Microscillaceae bacterium]|nr:CusA/CzcA family heavy metal efflux RND transporter [Microscillaceae bacterium]MDW8461507.1 CusA/CzcA family heavy metal efflux RND transporter [Cytophagales bacterium]